MAVPRAATEHPIVAAAAGRPGGAVRGRTAVVVVPAVFYPLPYIAVHVKENKGIGSLLRHPLGQVLAVFGVPAAIPTVSLRRGLFCQVTKKRQ